MSVFVVYNASIFTLHEFSVNSFMNTQREDPEFQIELKKGLVVKIKNLALSKMDSRDIQSRRGLNG